MYTRVHGKTEFQLEPYFTEFHHLMTVLYLLGPYFVSNGEFFTLAILIYYVSIANFSNEIKNLDKYSRF